MDYRSAVMVAQRNTENNNKKEIKYYSTKYEPPKKLQRNKTLSANIQKYLAQRDLEEKQKAAEARERRDKLLELRSQDKKATRRVSVMLKRTKSANKSAIADAIDKDNTSVTVIGPSQPDEDDYGYVSQSASDFYNKMMEKYNSMPEEPKYDPSRKKASGNLSTTKDRVRSALFREQEVDMQSHRRKRKSEEVYDEEPREKKEEKVKPKLKSAPVINFNDLLKIAEKKQFEPIIIEPKKEKEEERLLTKKQKREAEKEREYRENRERREKERALGIQAQSSKIPRLLESEKTPNPKPSAKSSSHSVPKFANRYEIATNRSENQKSSHSSLAKSSTVLGKKVSYLSKPPQKRETPRNDTQSVKSNELAAGELKPNQFSPPDIKPKQAPSRIHLKPPHTQGRPMAKRKPFPINKGRIYDDDDEYDSEMDDFIDDGPEESEDYSKTIGEIFGYDKRKYQQIDEDDDAGMESSFAQQMREEVISSKIGKMEDMEELRREEDHARQKALMRKRNY